MKKLKSEEAITILKDMKVDIPVPKAAVTQIKRNAAIDMAIDALKAQEVSNNSPELAKENGELIRRKAAINALNKEIIKRRLLDDVNDGMLDEFDTEDILRKLPPAQPDILSDGTLMIDVPDLNTVNRVIVSSGKMCKVFYLDDSEREADG